MAKHSQIGSRGQGRDLLVCLVFSGRHIGLGSMLGNIVMAIAKVGSEVFQPGLNLFGVVLSGSADCLNGFGVGLLAFTVAFGGMLLSCSLHPLDSIISY